MSYTVLRVIDAGVVLRDFHRARLGTDAHHAFDTFAAAASPGIYVLRWRDGALSTEVRASSRVVSGMPTRSAVSPFADQKGAFAKPSPPSPYDSVRLAGTATLLTDAASREIYESCAASVVAWNGSQLVIPPSDRPRVASVSERCVEEQFSVLRAPIEVSTAWPIALINAVALIVEPHVPGRDRFPDAQLQAVRASFEGTARRS